MNDRPVRENLGRADPHVVVVVGTGVYSDGVSDATRTCDFCGRTESDAGRLLLWTTAVENGQHKDFCDRCSREHLRSLEAKLDSEWW